MYVHIRDLVTLSHSENSIGRNVGCAKLLTICYDNTMDVTVIRLKTNREFSR
jgi:hypothetical protein